tara:strand:+ start:345 stop:566 length:222 start_codon:yes stop_codon:yes gene_type:complete
MLVVEAEAHTMVQVNMEQEDLEVEETVVVQEVQGQLVELQDQIILVEVAEVELTLVILEEQVDQELLLLENQK